MVTIALVTNNPTTAIDRSLFIKVSGN